ncbi:NADH-quinone oxidoreductase subunit M [Fluviicola sp.]|uniref:complex I subunit 4 family protein n=1 Tax=Fluviicola sp. TaxID=1917219 RepID=UPI00262632DC|nr:NADH-quinone oxidoreductase subunit M [Fluviicola sp.]
MEILLFILPVFFALSVLIVPKQGVRAYGIIGSLAVLGVVIACMMQYNNDGTIHLFTSNKEWLPGITLSFGYDGISLLMLLLTAVLVPLILLANLKNELAENRLFTSMVFFMQLGLIGVFISMDGLWFYVFWEITLIPIFLISWWFGAPERKAALMKFFIYTFVGSIAMLAALIGIKMGAKTFYIEDLKAVTLTAKSACWLALGFFLAFAIKIPIFPFHTWQPDTYTKSPMAGTMLLSGIMLKMALYGMVRWMIPLFPEALHCLQYPIIILATIGVVYAAIIAIKQKDIKRVFAFASMSHVGLIAAAIMTLNFDAWSGSMVQILNHGLVAVGLFLAVEIIERRTGTRNLDELGGFAKQAPKFAFWFAALAFASVSVPLTSGFIGEFLMLKGLVGFDIVIGVIAGTTLIFGAVYTFRAYQLSMYGPLTRSQFADLHWSELAVLAVIIIAVVIFGVYPAAITDFVNPSLKIVLETLSTPSGL